MSKRRGDINVNVGGDNHGQIAAGKRIHQQQIYSEGTAGLTPEETEEVAILFARLKAEIDQQAPQDLRKSALERVDELQQAVMDKAIDKPTIEYVAGWFRKQIPQLAESVFSLLINPLIGKLVGKFADTLSELARDYFSGHSNKPQR